MKILFITSNRLGDAVLSSGVLSYLLTTYPKAEFTIVHGAYCGDLFTAVPRLEKLIVLKKQKFNKHWLMLYLKCFTTRWDLVVDLRNSIVSRLLFSKETKILSKRLEKLHKVEENASILGIDYVPEPEIWIDPKVEKEVNQLIPDNIPIIAICPTANWVHKQLPMESWLTLIPMLLKDGFSIMILSSAEEQNQLEPLFQIIPTDKLIPVIGKNIQFACACIKKAKAYIGNDSGLMHIAAALKVPTIGLFGPGYPEHYAPYGTHCAVVKTKESREELLKILAKGIPEKHLMHSIRPEDIFTAVMGIMEN
ncbi:MAG: glycosyltransferase family 9 protein [Alphaproteobacteria bacterium]|nr:glycosyltransferase family 9 protein [Alphaproteobacteria bacterium]MCL2504686.1 glycosyltransferase family 9 protein [Alphaproteobacteria bacterium]